MLDPTFPIYWRISVIIDIAADPFIASLKCDSLSYHTKGFEHTVLVFEQSHLEKLGLSIDFLFYIKNIAPRWLYSHPYITLQKSYFMIPYRPSRSPQFKRATLLVRFGIRHFQTTLRDQGLLAYIYFAQAEMPSLINALLRILTISRLSLRNPARNTGRCPLV